jgi:transposase
MSTITHWVVGIDVGLKSAHKVAILDRRTGERIRRTFSVPRTWEGQRALRETLAQADRVEVAIEPAGNVWRPLAGVLIAAGLEVYLIDPKKSSRLRKALSDHVKSDRVDAEALARLLMMVPDKLDRLRPPPPQIARLRDLVRHRDRLVETTSGRKTRIQGLLAQIQPTLMEALGDDKFITAIRAYLRQYVDPRRVVRLGQTRLHHFLDRRHHGTFDPERIGKIFRAAHSGAQLLEAQQQQGSRLLFDPDQVQLQISMELDLLEAEEAQIHRLDELITHLYRELDPEGMLRTLPGFGVLIAAGILAETGGVARFPNVGRYRGYASLIPRYKATGQSHNPRQRLRKSGPRLLKKYLYLAAENARRRDVELADFYNRLRSKGRTHKQAVCAVANKLARRAYAFMKRMDQGDSVGYVFRDLDGQPISQQQARARVQSLSLATTPTTEAGRPRPANTRPPYPDASSSDSDTPRHISQILAALTLDEQPPQTP